MVHDPTHIRAELAGSVHQIEVKVDQEVTVGQTLLFLESMKMEIPVLSEISGRVTRIEVKRGESVSRGQLLITIAPMK